MRATSRFSLGLTRVFGALVILAACLTGACANMPTFPSSTVTSLAIIGTPPSPGSSAQYTANIVLANSSDVENVTSLVTWQVANTGIATVSKTGVVSGVTAGSTTISATYNGTTVTATLAIP